MFVTILTTSSRRFREEVGATKLFLSPLKGHDGNTAKKQYGRLVKPWINNNPTVRLQGGGDMCALSHRGIQHLKKCISY